MIDYSKTEEGKKLIETEIKRFNEEFGQLNDELLLAERIANLTFAAGKKKMLEWVEREFDNWFNLHCNEIEEKRLIFKMKIAQKKKELER